MDSPRTKRITQARKIVRDAKSYTLCTQLAHKDYTLVFNKRALAQHTAMTKSQDAEDVENIDTLADHIHEEEEEEEQGFYREAHHAIIIASL